MTDLRVLNTEPIKLHQVQHDTPIFDQLLADWGHTPGTLTEEQEEEMRAYAAELAADPNPVVKGFEPVSLVIAPGEVEVQPQALTPVVPVIRVGTLADKPQEAASAPQEAEEAPAEAQEPEYLPEAATQLLERVVPGTEETAVMPAVTEAETAVLPVIPAQAADEPAALVVSRGAPEPKGQS